MTRMQSALPGHDMPEPLRNLIDPVAEGSPQRIEIDLVLPERLGKAARGRRDDHRRGQRSQVECSSSLLLSDVLLEELTRDSEPHREDTVDGHPGSEAFFDIVDGKKVSP